IADTCGLLLADAMVLHIKRKEWPQLDRDELYKSQRLRFDKNFSWKGFGRRIDEAIAQMFSGQIVEQNSEVRRNQNGTVHLRMSENLQNGISDTDADLEDLADLERGVGHGEHSQRNKLSNVPPPQANGGRRFLVNSSAFCGDVPNGGVVQRNALYRRHLEAKAKKYAPPSEKMDRKNA
uniref:HTH OST-type domain-containing protein n=1 Tax=Globodera pallida TaxID=36090 RepID=A0A183CRS0_GLOPA